MKLRIVGLSDSEVRAASFGVVSRVIGERPASWKDARGSLWDVGCFGASEAWRCDCGKYAGEEHERMICDVCGVKIVSDVREAHSQRFGHINLAVVVSHPLIDGHSMQAFPVLPIGRRVGGRLMGVNLRYNSIIHANSADADGPQVQRSRLQTAISELLLGRTAAGVQLGGDGGIAEAMIESASRDPSLVGIYLFGMGLKFDTAA